jgi:hypothetical protein
VCLEIFYLCEACTEAGRLSETWSKVGHAVEGESTSNNLLLIHRCAGSLPNTVGPGLNIK